MYNTNKYVDFSVLAILGLFIASTVYSHFAEGFDFTVNNYLAFSSWLLVLSLRVLKYEKSYRLFFLMLLLASFEVINFTIGKDTLNIGHGVENTIHIPFNPCLFLLLIVYSVVNGNSYCVGSGYCYGVMIKKWRRKGQKWFLSTIKNSILLMRTN